MALPPSDDVWSALMEQIKVTSALVCTSTHDDSPIVAAEGIRHVTRLLTSAARTCMEAADANYPQFVRLLSPTLQYGLPAADCAYHYAPVRGEHTYRIHGTLGTARLFYVEIYPEIVAHLDRWSPFGGRGGGEFEVGPDRQFEIILSRDPQPGNWMPLPDEEGLGSVVVRQYFYDWENEEPAYLDIERVGAEYPPPPYSASRAAEGLALLQDFFAIVPGVCAQAAEQYYEAAPDVVPFRALPLGWKDLQYGMGHYRCEPDEAVILEATPPDSPYWGFQLSNHQWEAMDWNMRQSSLNGHQARVDRDGVFRAVISHRDPGVWNWLDPAGHTVGLIAARYFRPTEPMPTTLKTVPFSAVDEYLPSDTARVRPAERQESLRRRMLSVRRLMGD